MEDKNDNVSKIKYWIILFVLIFIWLGLCGLSEGYGFFEGVFKSVEAIIKLALIALGVYVLYRISEYFTNK